MSVKDLKMHRLTLDVQDNVLDKLFYFLKNLPKKEVKIINDEVILKEKNNDFISFLVNQPIHVDSNIEFLTRDESNAR